MAVHDRIPNAKCYIHSGSYHQQQKRKAGACTKCQCQLYIYDFSYQYCGNIAEYGQGLVKGRLPNAKRCKKVTRTLQRNVTAEAHMSCGDLDCRRPVHKTNNCSHQLEELKPIIGIWH